jgi:hypothetical protein
VKQIDSNVSSQRAACPAQCWRAYVVIHGPRTSAASVAVTSWSKAAAALLVAGYTM